MAESFWRLGPAPQDGEIVWAWLYDSGIRKVFWASPNFLAENFGGSADDYDGLYLEADDMTEEWAPKFWAPLDAIPEPRP